MKSTRRSRAWTLATRTGALGETPPLPLILRCESKNYLCPTPRPHTVSHGTTGNLSKLHTKRLRRES
jgi:hypothetical protein